MSKKIENEVLTAYADCHKPGERAYKIRNLSFRASSSVTVKEAIRILTKAQVYYNDFEPKLLKAFPSGSKITIAREGSVCLYVTGTKLPTAKKVKADERNVINGSVRYWWD